MSPRSVWVFVCAAASALGLAVAAKEEKQATPLPRAHAHNDYEHKRPLLDALEQGFCSVEADVYLIGQELLVGHTRLDLRPERTLEKLYLSPLKERVRTNGGRVYRDGPPFYLMIDVKTEAKTTYAAVDKQLERYGDMLSVTRDGKFKAGAVTVVISGNRDQDTIKRKEVLYAGIDGRPGDLDSEAPAHLIPWISASWGSLFRWNGDGPMPAAERGKLREFVAKAHKHGRMVRFWATLEKPEIWKELLAAKVDLINTDRLVELRRFLIENAPPEPKP
ncbi:MAG TPA: phosphatidylinositol-specific phospholipase C/glycerophosphodiester phosphodiesterase family protein [Gemmataceae bacterium]|nr:phosphatidylinositol-specific phospholipase C/glycerophosphodiester phosphodiesterase family protein [Gemmataceae bacterium]